MVKISHRRKGLLDHLSSQHKGSACDIESGGARAQAGLRHDGLCAWWIESYWWVRSLKTLARVTCLGRIRCLAWVGGLARIGCLARIRCLRCRIALTRVGGLGRIACLAWVRCLARIGCLTTFNYCQNFSPLWVSELLQLSKHVWTKSLSSMRRRACAQIQWSVNKIYSALPDQLQLNCFFEL